LLTPNRQFIEPTAQARAIDAKIGRRHGSDGHGHILSTLQRSVNRT
jgi:hypothetical protein